MTTLLLDMPSDLLLAFTNTLSTKDWHGFTDQDIADIGLFISTDGC